MDGPISEAVKEDQVNAKLRELGEAVRALASEYGTRRANYEALETRPIFALTYADFDDALELALDTFAETEDDFDKEWLTSERKANILWRVRRVVEWASSDWNNEFAGFVQDAAYGVLVRGEELD